MVGEYESEEDVVESMVRSCFQYVNTLSQPWVKVSNDTTPGGSGSGTAQVPCEPRLETLRSRIVVLQLEVTVLKAQRTTDRAALEQLKRDLAILHTSTQDLSQRLRSLSRILERVEALTTSMKQLSACGESSLHSPEASDTGTF